MSARTVLRKLSLRESSLDSIRNAVREAELRTTGEIAIAATEESSDYSFFELFAAVLLGAFAFALLIPLHGALEEFAGRLFWIDDAWHATAIAGIVSFGIVAIAFLAANVPFVDRLVIPRHVQKARVYNRAIRHFVESGAYATADRTGILIFVSVMEHEVRIIADEGISKKIPQSKWDEIASSLALGIRDRKTEESLIAAIGSCGELLSKHFPAKDENPNELPDGLVILEAGE